MRPPILITRASNLPALLRVDREALGLSGEELDMRIGWSDRYTAKVENPGKSWGKTVVRIDRTFDEWLAGLGRTLVLMDRADAEKLIAQHAEASSSTPDSSGVQRVRVCRWAFAA